MNQSARKHLVRASGLLEKGESFYHQAAEEIVAAQQADSTLSQREIGEWFDRSATWVRELVQWHTSARGSAPSPYAGSQMAVRKDTEKTRRILREAPLEQIEQIIDTLPKERKQQVLAAYGDPYSRARVEFDERERNLTPSQRKEREAGRQEVKTQVARALAPMKVTLGVANYLGLATEALKEMISDHALTPDLVEEIERADAEWRNELEVARAMAGMEMAS